MKTKFEHGTSVTAITNVWHNLVKAGHNGIVVKVLDTGYNVYFPLSHTFSYQDQIFFVTEDQIEANPKWGTVYH